MTFASSLSQYGAVDKVNIITDRDTGRSKGFGFVEMPESQAAKAAIQGLNGKELDGRALRSTKPSRVNRVVSRAAPAGKPARTVKSCISSDSG